MDHGYGFQAGNQYGPWHIPMGNLPVYLLSFTSPHRIHPDCLKLGSVKENSMWIPCGLHMYGNQRDYALKAIVKYYQHHVLKSFYGNRISQPYFYYYFSRYKYNITVQWPSSSAITELRVWFDNEEIIVQPLSPQSSERWQH